MVHVHLFIFKKKLFFSFVAVRFLFLLGNHPIEKITKKKNVLFIYWLTYFALFKLKHRLLKNHNHNSCDHGTLSVHQVLSAQMLQLPCKYSKLKTLHFANGFLQKCKAMLDFRYQWFGFPKFNAQFSIVILFYFSS